MIFDQFSNITSDSSIITSVKLTNIGKHQLYLLGSEFSVKYKTILSHIDPVDDVYIRSSGLDRSIESAHAFSIGIFADKKCKTLSSNQIMRAVPPIHVENLNNIKSKLGNQPFPACQLEVPIHSGLDSVDYTFTPHLLCDGFVEDEKKLQDIPNKLDKKYNDLYEEISKVLPKEIKPNKWNSDVCYLLSDNMKVVESAAENMYFYINDKTKQRLYQCSVDNTAIVYLRSNIKKRLVANVAFHGLLKSIELAKKNLRKLTIYSISDIHIVAICTLFGWELDDIVKIGRASCRKRVYVLV